MHIVLVDGSRTTLKFIVRMLEPRGDRVTVFSDGQDALEFVRSNSDVELVITSFEIARLPGTELCWNLRVLADGGRPIYVIAMSSNEEPHHVIGVLDAGADDFISKPPRPGELFARLRVAERGLNMQRRLLQAASTDQLSGLLNRRAFLHRFGQAIAEMQEGELLSLVMFDIDHFKKINDHHGHLAGDEVIREIGRLTPPKESFFARLGGEEFGVLLPRSSTDEAIDVAERLRDQLSSRIIVHDLTEIFATASFGVSTIGADGTFENLHRTCDEALYRAKNNGRNRVERMLTPVRTRFRPAPAGAE